MLHEEGIFTEYKWVVLDYQVTDSSLIEEPKWPYTYTTVLSEIKLLQATE